MEHVSSVRPTGSTGKFPEKLENLKRWARFPRWVEPPTITFSVVLAKIIYISHIKLTLTLRPPETFAFSISWFSSLSSKSEEETLWDKKLNNCITSNHQTSEKNRKYLVSLSLSSNSKTPPFCVGRYLIYDSYSVPIRWPAKRCQFCLVQSPRPCFLRRGHHKATI